MKKNVMAVLAALSVVAPLLAQVRVTPKGAKGGEKQGEPWAEVPESFRSLKIPDWPLPTDLKRWQAVDRLKTRETLLRLLGEMPRRPDPAMVKLVSKEDHDGYTLERFEFHNGVDNIVPGILLIPKDRKGPAPTIIGLHGHGSSKESICTNSKSGQFIGPALAQRGYVVATIVATARKLAERVYRLLKYGAEYVCQEMEAYEAAYRKRLIKGLTRRAAELGYRLELATPNGS